MCLWHAEVHYSISLINAFFIGFYRLILNFNIEWSWIVMVMSKLRINLGYKTFFNLNFILTMYVRRLEFLLADALNKKFDTIFTCGGVQSNHCRATAVAARQLGLDCYLFLRSSEQVSYTVYFLAMYKMNTFLNWSPLLDALAVWTYPH